MTGAPARIHMNVYVTILSTTGPLKSAPQYTMVQSLIQRGSAIPTQLMFIVASWELATLMVPHAYVLNRITVSRLSVAVSITYRLRRPPCPTMDSPQTHSRHAQPGIAHTATGWDIALLMVKRVRVTIPSTIGPPSAAPHITMDLNYSPVCFALPTAPMRIAVSWASAAQTGCHVNASTRRTDYPLSDAVCITLKLSVTTPMISVAVKIQHIAIIRATAIPRTSRAYVLMTNTIGHQRSVPHTTTVLNSSLAGFASPIEQMRTAASSVCVTPVGRPALASTRHIVFLRSAARRIIAACLHLHLYRH